MPVVDMSLADTAVLLLAGFASGVVNALAGGGTFITFGALTLIGLPPIAANATSAIAQLPGYLFSTVAYGRELKVIGRAVLPFLAVSLIGGVAGALVLLAIDNPQFRSAVPWLLIGATTLFAAGPRLAAALKTRRLAARPSTAWAVQLCVATYGGFFGAGLGIMMLASLGLTEGDDFHRLNAMKVLLSLAISLVAVAVFASGGVVAWNEALVMIVAVAVGGYAGVHAARRLPQSLVRGAVITIGIALTVYYAVSG